MRPSKTTPPGPGRGRKPGSGSAQARILDTLRKVAPLSLRAAELAAQAKVNHHSLAKCTGALLALGQITRCLVQPAKGCKTFEFRIAASDQPAAPFKPLDTAKSGVATLKHRSQTPLKPLPVTKPAPAPKPVAYAATRIEPDAALLARIQAMNEAQFGEYIGHLARVWAWGRIKNGKAA